MTIRGLDHANGVSPPSTQSIQKDGSFFVCRYISGETTDFWTKVIRPQEVQQLSAAGIDVVLNFERDGRFDLLGGAPNGDRYAKMCKPIIANLGAPASAPVIVSADWDMTLGGYSHPGTPGWANCQQIVAFMDAWAQVLGVYPGLYGGFYTLDACKQMRAAELKIGWQTVPAWSGSWENGRWVNHVQPWASILQLSSGWYVGGVECDVNAATTYDFGQWRLGGPHPNGPGPFDNFPVLKKGSSGAPTTFWQKVMNALHAKPQLKVDGSYGPATDAATRQFQTFSKLTVDGVVGVRTYTAAYFFLVASKINVNNL